jgi:abhydrolase domain-containing protein 17
MDWKQLIFTIFIGYAALTILVSLIAPNMMYAPPKSTYKPTQNTLVLSTADGVKIAANHYPNPSAHYTILYCNGNAADLGVIKPLMAYFNTKGFAVFAYDYHGYGLSGGVPSESATYLDAEAAYDYLHNTLKIPADRIIVYGKSLGAGVALQLALSRNVAGLVMESPFLSAYRTYTQFPLIFFDKYRNAKKITKLSCPLLVIHGKKDRVIPFWQGKKLYQMATVPKTKLWVETAGHNNVMSVAQNEYWHAWKQLITLIEQQGR